MKKILSLLVSLVLILTLAGCEGGYQYADLDLKGAYSRKWEGYQLNVYNWGEYISDGSDESIDVNREFERLTGIKVNYATFESNETLYSQLKSGGTTYDVIIPSDYMIQRLIAEDMLTQINVNNLSNYQYIEPRYKGLYYDENNRYSVAYNVGMVGVIYNSKLLGHEPEHSWNVLWDEQYADMALTFSNPRDAFMTAQILLGQDLNSTNKSDWDAAAELLKEQKDTLQSYVMDEVYGKMETGEAAIAPYYAGDFLTMYDNNPDLGFFYPNEGTNIFVDAVCVPKSVQNLEAAMMYINFLMEPDIALANAEYIGYASPNTAVINNPDYYYYGNEILYPAEEDTPPVQYYHNIDEEVRMYYENLWIDVKLY